MKGIMLSLSLFVKVCNIQVDVPSLLGTIYPRESSQDPQTWAHLGYVLSTGSRDHHILHRDVRQPAPYMRTLESIRICGWHIVFFPNRKGYPNMRWMYEMPTLTKKISRLI